MSIFHRMMDTNYPTSSFADPLAPPAQVVASWAYERNSASLKASSSYGAGHLDTELLQRQSYTSPHLLPSYSTSQLSAAGSLDTSGNSTESSIMSFLSAMESRTLQSGPASASLLPPLRPTSWSAGANSSSTELYLTGALPSSATFPSPAALSSYQHPVAYTTRGFSSNPSVTLPDATFSTSANGLFPHDSPLHVKSSQMVLPSALTLNHLSGPLLGSALPVQSSTYRSAQESAPHLLQPQFSLLPVTLPVTHSATHPYESTTFSLQRECSVIKHLQRHSSSHAASEQLSNSEHSLHGYFGSGNGEEVSYQHASCSETSVSCRSSTGAILNTPRSKTISTQAYPPTSVLKTTDCSPTSQNLSAESSDHYTSTVHKPNSVIAHQQSMQISSLISNGLSQPYISPQPSYVNSDKLPALYKIMPSFSSSSDSATPVSQSSAYSSRPGLSQEQVVQYQIQGLCQANPSERFPSSQAQGVLNVASTPYSQGQVSATQPQTCTTAHSINPSYQHTTPLTTNSTQAFSIVHTAEDTKSHDTLSRHGVQVKHINETKLFPLENSASSSQQDYRQQLYDKHKLGELAGQTLQALNNSSSDGTVNNQHNIVLKTEGDGVIRGNLHSDDNRHTNTTQNNKIGSLVNGQDNTKVSNSGVLTNSEELQIKSTDTSYQNPSPSLTSITHSQFISGSQVLLEPNQMILLQQPLIHHDLQKTTLVQGEDIGPALQMAREILGITTQIQRVSGTNLESTDSLKHHFIQNTNQHSNDPKNQFVLNSICFPDSILLADDRHMLSNVDDILAATVAACGVAPQEFAKSPLSTESNATVMVSPATDKSFFQTVVSSVDLGSPNLSSAASAIRVNSNVITLNSALGMTSESVSDTDRNGDVGNTENNVQNSVGQTSEGLQNNDKGKCKTEDGLIECLVDDFPKKKVCPRATPTRFEEDCDQPKTGKRSGQPKRQILKGADVSSPSAPHSSHDGCAQQERIRQKIREVEEKQPEVKTGFMGSFLDFIKSGPKQQFSPNPSRTINRTKKVVSAKPPASALHQLPPNLQTLPASYTAQDSKATVNQKRLDEDLQKNLETLPSFSSDEEENTGRNQALRNSISSALSALDETTDRKVKTDSHISVMMIKPESAPALPNAVPERFLPKVVAPVQMMTITVPAVPVLLSNEETRDLSQEELAVELKSVAIEGLTDEELSDSGGEGMYRERDEFVVRNEDIESLKVTMTTGSEPPAIWKVQKALLQKFVPELRDGKRVFSATNSYLGYFGDAKTMYQRIYVKFLDTVNKREYVRVCSRKPRCKPITSLRGLNVKTMLSLTASPATFSQKPRPKPVKMRAEPPPKKRKKWKEEFSPPASGSSAEDAGDRESASCILDTRTMRDTFKSFVELLIGVALDEDALSALENSNDELLLPHMQSVDGLIADKKKHLLQKLHIGQVLKTALDNFPEMSVVTELNGDGETLAYKVRLSGRAYNKKNMKTYRMPNKLPQEYNVDQQRTQLFSLYHSMQHFKYHTFLMCKDKIASLRLHTGSLGQEETVQECLKNDTWVERLFVRFKELVNQVQQVCR